MILNESAEMYLETTYCLSKTQATVRSIDVAEAPGYSRPSVSRAVGLLKQANCLTMDDSSFLALTESGLEIAQKIYERHTVLSAALTALGVAPETAAEDACKIEHVISDKAFAAVQKHLQMFGK